MTTTDASGGSVPDPAPALAPVPGPTPVPARAERKAAAETFERYVAGLVVLLAPGSDALSERPEVRRRLAAAVTRAVAAGGPDRRPARPPEPAGAFGGSAAPRRRARRRRLSWRGGVLAGRAAVGVVAARWRRVAGRTGVCRPRPAGAGWRLVAGGVAAGAVCGVLYAWVAVPQYVARGHVLVRVGAGEDAAAAVGLAQVYGRLADDPVVLREAGRLPGEVRASTSPDAPVIEITGTADEPRTAAAVANAVAPALVAYGNAAEPPSGAELAVLSPALPPSGPSSPTAGAAVAVGACSGAVLSCLVLLAGAYRREAEEIQ
jgi:hypothetical protein